MGILNYQLPLLNGQMQELSAYAGKVVLVVNTASDCGYTYQYAGLEALYQEFKEQGLVVLGFPCNQFGQQERADNAAIGSFCQKNFGVTFPMFSKVIVNGANAEPFYEALKSEAPGILGTKAIKWNFTKFLIGRDGNVVKRFATATKPEKLVEMIKKELAK